MGGRSQERSRLALAAARVDAADWQAAVRASAGLLVGLGVAEWRYAEACVRVVIDKGPYIVLTRGAALAHARPEQGVLGLGVSVVRLAAPVAFGHATNDPVDVVFALASPDSQAHLDALRSLARALSAGLAQDVRGAGDDADLLSVLGAAVDPGVS